jgi:hypothetical protein
MLPDPNIQHQSQYDPGANISATNNINVLPDTVALESPFSITSADRTALAMMVSVHGIFVLPLLDGVTCDIPMNYCQFLADTIISPQHFTSWYNGYCLIDMPGCCRIFMSNTNDNDASFIALQKSKYMYVVSGSAPGSSGYCVSRLATKPQLLSELWNRRLGHPGLMQLIVLDKLSTCLPSQLTAGLHHMHDYQACSDGMIRRAPMGPTSDKAHLLSSTRFHLDFGFLRSLSADFGVSVGNCVVTSYDGNNTYLIILCTKAHHTWVFCQASKSPPIFIIENFLALNGLKTGPSFAV